MPKSARFVPLPEVIPGGMIIQPDHPASPLPLEKTTITGQVIGPLNLISLTQHFSNPLSKTVELEYLFPLPHKAAIVDFEIHISKRVIRGELRETEKAREDYEQALANGQQAALMEQRRPNLFAVRLANILPGESIQATMRYQEPLPYRDGEYELVIPMGLTPKYTSPTHPQEGVGVDAPLAYKGEKIGSVEINLAIHAGTVLGDPISPSHALTLSRLDEQRVNLCLATPTIPDHDFVVRLPVARENIRLSAFCSPHASGDVFLASILAPISQEMNIESQPREFIFVLDRSGSMSGEPIAQARNALRACLRILDERDSFRILLFDDVLEWYRDAALPITQANIDQADRFLNQVEGRGGTEIIQAIQAAVGIPPQASTTRYIIFLTDGAVSSEERAVAEVRNRNSHLRFFTFGIGPSVNRVLLQKLAEVGRGTCEFLQLNEDIEGAILRFQDRISYPVMTDLQYECVNGSVWDCYPATLPDIFAGNALQLVGRIKKMDAKVPSHMVIRGQQAGQPIELQIELNTLPAPEPCVLRAWAHARVEHLEESAAFGTHPEHSVRDEIIAMALEHRLVTRYTSFAAIDSAIVNRDGKPLLLQVSQPLPEGLNIEGFGGSYANMLPAMAPPVAPLPASRRRFNKSAIQIMDASMDLLSENIQLSKNQIDYTLPGRVDFDFSPEEIQKTPTPEDTMRWLVRSQNLDGSWSQGGEFIALALLCFVRHGQTTHSGYYRQQVKRAVKWISQANLTGLTQFLAALAVKELAELTTQTAHQELAARLRSNLPVPSAEAEQIALDLVLGKPVATQPLKKIQSLSDLQKAALMRQPVSHIDELDTHNEDDIYRLWRALL